MLAIKIKDEFLDLSDNTSITIKLSSPVFATIGDHTYPFKLPSTPKNKRLLGWKHKVELERPLANEFDVVMEWDGMFMMSGSLKVKKAQNDYYEATIYMNKGDFYYRIKSTTLQQIDFGTMEFDTELDRIVYINQCAEIYHDQRIIGFPQIADTAYFDPASEDEEQSSINFYKEQLIGENWTIYPTTTEGNRTIIIPMVYLRFILQKVFDKLEYKFNDKFFYKDDDFNRLMIFNLVDCNGGEDGTFKYPLNKILLNYHIPHATIFDFLSGLESYFGIRLFVNNKYREIELKTLDDIVKSTEYSTLIDNVMSVYVDVEKVSNGFLLSMTPDNGDEWSSVITGWDEAIVKNIKNAVETFADLTPWPGSPDGEIRFVISENKFYRMETGSWTEFNTNEIELWTKYVYKNNGGETITTKVIPLSDWVGFSGVECIKAQSDWSDLPFRPFFIKPYYFNEKRYRMQGSSSSELRSLFYKGATGIFNKQYRAFLDMKIASKCVKMNVMLPFIDLIDFDFSKKYYINGMKYLIADIQFNITNTKINPASITAYTCD